MPNCFSFIAGRGLSFAGVAAADVVAEADPIALVGVDVPLVLPFSQLMFFLFFPITPPKAIREA